MGWLKLRIGASKGSPAHWDSVSKDGGPPAGSGLLKLKQPDGTWHQHTDPEGDPYAVPLRLSSGGWTPVLSMVPGGWIPAMRSPALARVDITRLPMSATTRWGIWQNPDTPYPRDTTLSYAQGELFETPSPGPLFSPDRYYPAQGAWSKRIALGDDGHFHYLEDIETSTIVVDLALVLRHRRRSIVNGVKVHFQAQVSAGAYSTYENVGPSSFGMWQDPNLMSSYIYHGDETGYDSLLAGQQFTIAGDIATAGPYLNITPDEKIRTADKAPFGDGDASWRHGPNGWEHAPLLHTFSTAGLPLIRWPLDPGLNDQPDTAYGILDYTYDVPMGLLAKAYKHQQALVFTVGAQEPLWPPPPIRPGYGYRHDQGNSVEIFSVIAEAY